MKIKFVSTATMTKIIVFLAFVFVSVGDLFLPEPLKTASKDTKENINAMVLSVLPKKQFKDPHDRTEKAVDQLEQGAGGAPK